jgi:hypothetical protein
VEATTFGSTVKMRNVLLFNDLLLCTSDSQHYRGSIDLASAAVADVVDKKRPFGTHSYMFLVSCVFHRSW